MTPLIVLPAESWKWFSHVSFFYKGESRWNNSLHRKDGCHLLVKLFVEVRGGCDRETEGICNPMPQSKPCFFVCFCLNVTIFHKNKSTLHSIKHETSNWDQKPIRKVFAEVVGQTSIQFLFATSRPLLVIMNIFIFSLISQTWKLRPFLYVFILCLYICLHIYVFINRNMNRWTWTDTMTSGGHSFLVVTSFNSVTARIWATKGYLQKFIKKRFLISLRNISYFKVLYGLIFRLNIPDKMYL